MRDLKKNIKNLNNLNVLVYVWYFRNHRYKTNKRNEFLTLVFWEMQIVLMDFYELDRCYDFWT